MATPIEKVYSIRLAVQGENATTPIEIDMTTWAEEFPNASFYILFKPYNTTDVVPVITEYVDHILRWVPTIVNTAIAGVGYTEVRAIDSDTGLIKKSRIIPTSVENSVSGYDGIEPPSPAADWVNAVLESKIAAENAANTAIAQTGIIDQVILIQDEEPTAEHNKLYIKKTPSEAVEVATEDELTALRTEIQGDLAEIQEDVQESVKYTSQTLTDAQQAQARGNIGAADQGEVTELKSQINDVYIGKPLVEIGINKLNPSEIEAGIRINDDGSETADSTMDSTGFIELDTTKTSVAFTGLNSGGTARVCLPIIHILFFAADKTTIISHSWYIPSRTVVEIPTNAVYTRMSVGHDHMTGRQPMVEFVDSTSEISPIYVAYNEVVERSHGLNYLDETQQAILGRLDDVEEEVAEIDVVSDQVDANTTAIADILGTSQTIDKLAAFTNGGIRSTTGEFVGIYTYRVATPNIATLAKNITVTIETGFRLYAARFINGVFQSAGWVSSGTEFDAGSEVRLMVARTTEDQSEVADVDLFCSKVTYTPDGGLSDITEQLNENTEAIANNNAVITYGITWDWWITCNSVDTFGNAYIGYVDTDGYAGIIRRQPDGAMQYKRLEKLANDDDHNACATMVLDDGRILVIGSYGHTVNNHIICWRSVNPYSIDEMEKLSFDIPQTGGYTYKTCYSQVIKYNGKLFDFMRFGSIPSGSSSGTYGFACLISADNGSTWTPYKAFNGTDAYNSIAQCTDDEKYIKIIVAANPAAGANTFRGCYIDLSTYAIYDLSDNQIGTMVPLDNGPITDSSCAQKADMTALIPQTQSGLMGRLFFTAPTPKANTVFLYATALDTAGTDFEYKRYADGTITELGNSGVGFGNVHYISGACFGKNIDTIYYANATTAIADGPHELHKVKVANNAVSSDDIITEASMCVLRPLFLGNGELATVVGRYNDQNSDGTYNGSFTAWELKPLFTDA